MIFQVVLIATLFWLAFYAYSQRSRSPAVALIVSLLAVVGMVFAAAPELSNYIARLLGIGRGADLLFYCFILITLVTILNVHLRLRAQQDQIAELARAIALSGAFCPVLSNE